MKLIVAHIRSLYLGISETFIYSYIVNFQRYKPIVLTKKTENLDLFPLDSLYCAPTLECYSRQWGWEKICKKLLNRDLYYEYIIKNEKAKLIHAHFGPEGVNMLGVKKRLKIPLITTFYGWDMSKLPQEKKWQKLYKKLFSKGDLFLVEGNHMKKELIKLGCPGAKVKIQHIAIDVNKIEYQPRKLNNNDGQIRILFCGRFVEKKGLIFALEAIRILVPKFPNLEFRVIGDGQLRKEVEKFIKTMNIEKNVVLLGSQPHHVFLDEIKKSHILLQPSVTAQNGDSEGGAPTVLLEAQAAGVPIVSTYHADIPEVVVDKKSGFLVVERDSQTLAKKLDYLISNPGLWPEMGEYGRKHIEENYNIRKEVSKLEIIYDEILSRVSNN